MPTRRFERIALAQLLVGGCAVVFSACVLIELAQAQYVPPPTPPPPPVLNPSNPGTVPQPSYKPITPSTPSTAPSTPSNVPSSEVTPPANEEHPSTTTQSEQPSVAETQTVHHHHHRGRYIGMGPSLGSFDCSYFSWCVRISPPYAYYRPNGWYRY
jgi:hypothetical protein